MDIPPDEGSVSGAESNWRGWEGFSSSYLVTIISFEAGLWVAANCSVGNYFTFVNGITLYEALTSHLSASSETVSQSGSPPRWLIAKSLYSNQTQYSDYVLYLCTPYSVF